MERRCSWANQEESLKIRSQVSQAMSALPFDIVVNIAGGRVRGHSRTLAASSPVMKALIGNAPRAEIHLPNIPERIFKIILVYAYIERAVFKTCDALELLVAALQLEMAGLKDICIKRLQEDMNLPLAMDCLHAAFQHNIVELRAKCGEIMSQHAAHIVETGNFLTLSPAELQWFLSLLLGNASLDYIANALCAWFDHSYKVRDESMSHALTDYSLLKLIGPHL